MFTPHVRRHNKTCATRASVLVEQLPKEGRRSTSGTNSIHHKLAAQLLREEEGSIGRVMVGVSPDYRAVNPVEQERAKRLHRPPEISTNMHPHCHCWFLYSFDKFNSAF